MQWMQLDQNGDANSWSLGEFLAQDEVRVMMLDPACTKSLTFPAEDDGSLDDIPSSTDAFTAAGPGPSSAASDGLHVIERVQKRHGANGAIAHARIACGSEVADFFPALAGWGSVPDDEAAQATAPAEEAPPRRAPFAPLARESDITAERFAELAALGQPFIVEDAGRDLPLLGLSCEEYARRWPNGSMRAEYLEGEEWGGEWGFFRDEAEGENKVTRPRG
ncbi:hypothetical protein EMIHUDRAFT_255946 [Emiliania huxleyi CCMP1516]|uniref:Uncharacterized protein n=2 Tax=Emiliania huxleyi TaxID=2903 RepID=A0A0D3J1A3_EMIH1|nr:hypothetical protein EMIHUDRAFT_255946 [Emiliania huxleyi CCMP1516]EOD17288.1 hypothetical protein EMIHUDRAFT_255946 [Emiliania huxleyi CCMP1516]|eukprot:XP_005769717.1 hypothetical protein EMIHUDRAFT_255946 [Emiliania huxleyi CCMP1516]